MAAAARGLLGLGPWGGSLGGEPRPGGGEPGFADGRARRATPRLWASRALAVAGSIALPWAVRSQPARDVNRAISGGGRRNALGARPRLNPTPLWSGRQRSAAPGNGPLQMSAHRRGKSRATMDPGARAVSLREACRASWGGGNRALGLPHCSVDYSRPSEGGKSQSKPGSFSRFAHAPISIGHCSSRIRETLFCTAKPAPYGGHAHSRCAVA